MTGREGLLKLTPVRVLRNPLLPSTVDGWKRGEKISTIPPTAKLAPALPSSPTATTASGLVAPPQVKRHSECIVSPPLPASLSAVRTAVALLISVTAGG